MERTCEKQPVGEWHWFVGSCEDDDEMMMADSREEAISLGLETMGNDGCYIIEACFYEDDEAEMNTGARDTAPFAQSRNGEWVEHKGTDDANNR